MNNKILGILTYLGILFSFSLFVWVVWKFLLLPTYTSRDEAIALNVFSCILWVTGSIGISIASLGKKEPQ